jgi:hypothetical protein
MGTFRNFRVKHLFIGVLAATGLSISGADAATVLWDFGVGAGGNQGTTLTQDSVPFGIPIVASGFTGIIGTPTDLFRKEAGGDEQGLGLTNDPTGDDEITPGSFIQLDLSALTIPPLTSLTLSFAADSTTPPDEWSLFLSNTAGIHPLLPSLTGTTEFPTIESINTTGFRFLDMSAVAGNVLLREIDASAVPEPSTWAMMLLGFAGLGFFGYRRTVKARIAA